MSIARVANSSIHAIYEPLLVNQPIELFRLICSYLNPRNAIDVGSTNRHLYQLLLLDTPLWNSFLQRYFPDSCANLQPKVESALLYKQLTVIERNIRANNYRFLTLNGHKGGILRVIVHENQLISGSFDRTIKTWDLEKGQELLSFTGHREGINSLVVYKDKVISSSFDFTIKIWDLKNGQELKSLTGHDSCVKSAIVWNGKLFSGSWDHTIKIWGLENGQELKTLIGHTKGINCLVVYKGKLISCSHDNTIKIWDPESGEVLQTLTGHVGGINDIIVHNDKLISGSFDFTIKIWDLENGQVLRTLTGHDSGVVTLLVHNGKLISGSWDKTIKIWNLESGQLLQTLKEHQDWVTSIVIHNEKLISSSRDKTIKIWNFSFPYSKQILEENLEILEQMAHPIQQPNLVKELAQTLHSDFKQHLEHHFHKLGASFSNSKAVILRVQTEVYVEALLLAIYDKDLDRVSNLLMQFIAIDPRNAEIYELLGEICKEPNDHERCARGAEQRPPLTDEGALQWAKRAFHNDPEGDIPLSKKEEAVIAFKQILRDRWDKEERDALFGVF